MAFIKTRRHELFVQSSSRRRLSRVGLVVRVSAFHTVSRRFASGPGHTKDNHKNGSLQTASPHRHGCVRVRV